MTTTTIIAAVMNRNDRVPGAIFNWLEVQKVDQIVLVDWSSDIPVEVSHKRLRLIRVEGRPTWHMTRAYNLAARFAECDVLCKMDIDYRMLHDFYEPPAASTFARGDWKLAQEQNDTYLNGYAAIWREDFNAVNGYNERLTGHGYDDVDLYKRLVNWGIKDIRIGPGRGLTHMPHLDRLRRMNCNDGNDTRANEQESKKNPWTTKDKQAEYDIHQQGYEYLVAHLLV